MTYSQQISAKLKEMPMDQETKALCRKIINEYGKRNGFPWLVKEQPKKPIS